ncbi:MAG: radical SAM protein [Spirochaetaceae bacterium]
MQRVDEIRASLNMDLPEFRESFFIRAGELRAQHYGNTIAVAGLLALGNICKNRCLYCGLRGPNTELPRFRLSVDEIKRALEGIREQGIHRLFMISGEDPGRSSKELVESVRHASKLGFRVMLGFGVLPSEVYAELKEAGAELYALKFETSNPRIFSSVKPDISFDERMQSIYDVQKAGFALGSGNIVGLPGESLDDIASDIELMERLKVDWAPVVPYLPSPATPLGKTHPMGSVELLLKEIALVRLALPFTLITAGQPTQGSPLGFADPQGTKDAIAAGANLLFIDLTPKERREDFAITSRRVLPRLESIDSILADLELEREHPV